MALDLIPSETVDQVEGMISPRVIAGLAVLAMAWGGLHLLGVGEVVDWAFAGYVSFKGGYAFGSDLVQYVRSAWWARDQKDLQTAATYFARAVSMAGVNTIMFLATHKIGSTAQMDTTLEANRVEEYESAQSAISAERLKQEFAYEGGRRMSKPQVSDPELQKIVDTLYKEGSVWGKGSSQDALRREMSTGKRTYDRTGKPTQHWQKAVEEQAPKLMKWIREHVTADLHDRNTAWDLLVDILDAAKLRPPSRALIEDAVNRRLPKIDELEREP